MPELPEVEVIRRGLEPVLTGRKIVNVQVLHPRPVRWDGPQAFVKLLAGRTFSTPKRRGKYLWFPLDDTDALVAHLGMSGQFRINEPGDPLARNTRVIFSLDNGCEVRFVDQRMFGGLQYSAGGAYLPSQITHIGRDLFDPDFDMAATVDKLRARRSTVKRSILDQKIVSGIGNIYADEALWQAKTHYDYPSNRLSLKRAKAVLTSAKDVMLQALSQGGTSFDALYVNVNGSSGYFGRSLNVYGRTGQPCPRCGTKIRRDVFMNRGSFFCPRCQRLPKSNRGVK